MPKIHNVKETASKLREARTQTHPIIFYGLVLCTIFFVATQLSPEGMQRQDPSESYYWTEEGYIQIGQPPEDYFTDSVETPAEESQTQEPETQEPSTESTENNELERVETSILYDQNNILSDVVDVSAETEELVNEPTQNTSEESNIPDRTFGRWTGQQIIDEVTYNQDSVKFYNAFKEKHGKQVADEMAVVLKFENGSFKPTTTGVCSPKFRIAGDYRNCNYADINSNGFDAGMLQVNTHYQSSRIAKLGGPSCIPANNKDITDPCTKSKVDWLHNTDNNLAIALNIYEEQGWRPWVGAKRAGIVPW